MQRRDFFRAAILGTGALATVSLTRTSAAMVKGSVEARLHSQLAKVETRGEESRWRLLDHCASDGCAANARMRISIDALGFPSTFRSLAIDAMFATAHGAMPVRVASFQRDAVSPASKPFAFDVAGGGLAGFRAEHSRSGSAAAAITSSALLSGARPTLTAGRYLLALAHEGDLIDFDAITLEVDPAAAVVEVQGNAPTFAWLSFSVQPSST